MARLEGLAQQTLIRLRIGYLGEEFFILGSCSAAAVQLGIRHVRDGHSPAGCMGDTIPVSSLQETTTRDKCLACSLQWAANERPRSIRAGAGVICGHTRFHGPHYRVAQQQT
jgi:hypothetical protein